MRVNKIVTGLSVGLSVCVLSFGALFAEEPSVADELKVPLHSEVAVIDYPISSDEELTQKYFNQGVSLMYGFWISEARRSFDEAARLDPSSAMAQWGRGIAYGPYLNNGSPDEKDLTTAYDATQQALKLSENATTKEKALIETLSTRYDKDPSAERAPLDKAYHEAMKSLAVDYPDDVQVQTMAASSYMNTTRWNYWDKEGKPNNEGTDWLVGQLERVLKMDGRHPGGIHYYIHAVEASDNPDRAVPYAQILPSTMPGVAHLVHMSSHILIQTGYYADAADTNIDAAIVDEFYIGQPDQEGRYPMGSYYHNVHFVWSAAQFEGRSALAIQTAYKLRDRVRNTTPANKIAESSRMQLFTSIPLFAMARFGKWDDISAEPLPRTEYLFETGIWHYARGLAEAAGGDYEQAETHRAAVAAIAEDEDLPSMGRVSAKEMLRLAATALNGDIHSRQNKFDDAVRLYYDAINIQDHLAYSEPPPWYYPMRQALGHTLLEAGKPQQAEVAFREDLKKWRENGWSLYGLLQALRAQGKTREAEKVEKRFMRAWVRSDVALTAAKF